MFGLGPTEILIVLVVLIAIGNPHTRSFALGCLGVGCVVLVLSFFVFTALQPYVSSTEQPVQPFADYRPAALRSLPQAPAIGLLPLDAPDPEAALDPQAAEDQPLSDPDRPAWVDAPGGFENGVYRTIAVSDPYTTKQEADVALNYQMMEVTRRYLEKLDVPLPDQLPLDTAYIRLKICKDEFTEVLDTSVGPMRRVHVLMEFDAAVAEDLKRRLHGLLVHQRITQAGAAAVWVLALLGTVFGYLKLDTATKGSYTRRLQLGAAGAILALVAAALAIV